MTSASSETDWHKHYDQTLRESMMTERLNRAYRKMKLKHDKNDGDQNMLSIHKCLYRVYMALFKFYDGEKSQTAFVMNQLMKDQQGMLDESQRVGRVLKNPRLTTGVRTIFEHKFKAIWDRILTVSQLIEATWTAWFTSLLTRDDDNMTMFEEFMDAKVQDARDEFMSSDDYVYTRAGMHPMQQNESAFHQGLDEFQNVVYEHHKEQLSRTLADLVRRKPTTAAAASAATATTTATAAAATETPTSKPMSSTLSVGQQPQQSAPTTEPQMLQQPLRPLFGRVTGGTAEEYASLRDFARPSELIPSETSGAMIRRVQEDTGEGVSLDTRSGSRYGSASRAAPLMLYRDPRDAQGMAYPIQPYASHPVSASDSALHLASRALAVASPVAGLALEAGRTVYGLHRRAHDLQELSDQKGRADATATAAQRRKAAHRADVKQWKTQALGPVLHQAQKQGDIGAQLQVIDKIEETEEERYEAEEESQLPDPYVAGESWGERAIIWVYGGVGLFVGYYSMAETLRTANFLAHLPTHLATGVGERVEGTYWIIRAPLQALYSLADWTGVPSMIGSTVGLGETALEKTFNALIAAGFYTGINVIDVAKHFTYKHGSLQRLGMDRLIRAMKFATAFTFCRPEMADLLYSAASLEWSGEGRTASFVILSRLVLKLILMRIPLGRLGYDKLLSPIFMYISDWCSEKTQACLESLEWVETPTQARGLNRATFSYLAKRAAAGLIRGTRALTNVFVKPLPRVNRSVLGLTTVMALEGLYHAILHHPMLGLQPDQTEIQVLMDTLKVTTRTYKTNIAVDPPPPPQKPSAPNLGAYSASSAPPSAVAPTAAPVPAAQTLAPQMATPAGVDITDTVQFVPDPNVAPLHETATSSSSSQIPAVCVVGHATSSHADGVVRDMTEQICTSAPPSSADSAASIPTPGFMRSAYHATTSQLTVWFNASKSKLSDAGTAASGYAHGAAETVGSGVHSATIKLGDFVQGTYSSYVDAQRFLSGGAYPAGAVPDQVFHAPMRAPGGLKTAPTLETTLGELWRTYAGFTLPRTSEPDIKQLLGETKDMGKLFAGTAAAVVLDVILHQAHETVKKHFLPWMMSDSRLRRLLTKTPGTAHAMFLYTVTHLVLHLLRKLKRGTHVPGWMPMHKDAGDVPDYWYYRQNKSGRTISFMDPSETIMLEPSDINEVMQHSEFLGHAISLLAFLAYCRPFVTAVATVLDPPPLEAKTPTASGEPLLPQDQTPAAEAPRTRAAPLHALPTPTSRRTRSGVTIEDVDEDAKVDSEDSDAVLVSRPSSRSSDSMDSPLSLPSPSPFLPVVPTAAATAATAVTSTGAFPATLPLGGSGSHTFMKVDKQQNITIGTLNLNVNVQGNGQAPEQTAAAVASALSSGLLGSAPLLQAPAAGSAVSPSPAPLAASTALEHKRSAPQSLQPSSQHKTTSVVNNLVRPFTEMNTPSFTKSLNREMQRRFPESKSDVRTSASSSRSAASASAVADAGATKRSAVEEFQLGAAALIQQCREIRQAMKKLRAEAKADKKQPKVTQKAVAEYLRKQNPDIDEDRLAEALALVKLEMQRKRMLSKTRELSRKDAVDMIRHATPSSSTTPASSVSTLAQRRVRHTGDRRVRFDSDV